MAGIYIGEILVEHGVLTEDQVRQILTLQKSSGRPFGDLAERFFGIDPRCVEDAWVEQYVRMTGTVDLQSIRIDEQCLRTINRRQAWQFHMLPCYRDNDALHVATDAESLVRALNFSTKKVDEAVIFQVAERRQLCDFLMRHYPVPQFVADYAGQM